MKKFLGALLIMSLSTPAHAKPIAGVEASGVKIVLSDDPCALSEVKNLPYAATWTEDGKVVPGCWAEHPHMPVVMAYWGDHTVTLIPNQALHIVSQI